MTVFHFDKFASLLITIAFGFAMVWQMWIPAVVAFVVMVGAIVVHTFNYNRDYYIPADEVVRVEAERTRLLNSHV